MDLDGLLGGLIALVGDKKGDVDELEGSGLLFGECLGDGDGDACASAIFPLVGSGSPFGVPL